VLLLLLLLLPLLPLPLLPLPPLPLPLLPLLLVLRARTFDSMQLQVNFQLICISILNILEFSSFCAKSAKGQIQLLVAHVIM
jgi:hypothetical protein